MASNPAIVFEFLVNLNGLDACFTPVTPAPEAKMGIEYPQLFPLLSKADQTLSEQARHVARAAIVGGLNRDLSSRGSLGDYFPDITAFSDGER